MSIAVSQKAREKGPSLTKRIEMERWKFNIKGPIILLGFHSSKLLGMGPFQTPESLLSCPVLEFDTSDSPLRFKDFHKHK